MIHSSALFVFDSKDSAMIEGIAKEIFEDGGEFFRNRSDLSSDSKMRIDYGFCYAFKEIKGAIVFFDMHLVFESLSELEESGLVSLTGYLPEKMDELIKRLSEEGHQKFGVSVYYTYTRIGRNSLIVRSKNVGKLKEILETGCGLGDVILFEHLRGDEAKRDEKREIVWLEEIKKSISLTNLEENVLNMVIEDGPTLGGLLTRLHIATKIKTDIDSVIAALKGLCKKKLIDIIYGGPTTASSHVILEKFPDDDELMERFIEGARFEDFEKDNWRKVVKPTEMSTRFYTFWARVQPPLDEFLGKDKSP